MFKTLLFYEVTGMKILFAFVDEFMYLLLLLLFLTKALICVYCATKKKVYTILFSMLTLVIQFYLTKRYKLTAYLNFNLKRMGTRHLIN